MLGRTVLLSIFIFGIWIGAAVPSSNAQGIAILDCNGFTRAVQSVKPGEISKVEVHLADGSGAPANGVNVTLTNTATGETVTTTAKGGVAVFENVSPGAFSVGVPAGTGAQLASVSIGSAAFGTAAAGAAVAGGGVAVGGAGAATVQVVDQVQSPSKNETPQPTPSSGGSTPSPTAEPTPAPTAPVNVENCNCDPSDTPPPVGGDGFYPQQLSPST